MAFRHDYIYDWNEADPPAIRSAMPFELLDETLRDGLQSPSVTDPPAAKKIEIVHLMASLGISVADIGIPCSGRRAYNDTLAIARHLAASRLPILPTCAARTTQGDITPVVEIVQKTGLPIELYAFIGSSPIRLFAEDWDLDVLRVHIEAAVQFAMGEGLEVCLVTEDTTRSRPEVLSALFSCAVNLGVRRLCLCDTVGHATPQGVAALMRWTQDLLKTLGAAHVALDWHGHNDRGLAVANSLSALANGAQRVHGTGLGIGERVGNAPLDQILLNLKLLDIWKPDLSQLITYCETIAQAFDAPIPHNYPLVGRDAFRTGTGVHASAIIKAHRKSDAYLADRVYSVVPAGWFGRRQEIEIGHMSGMSNVVFWLESRNIPYTEELCEAIFAKAKGLNRLLSESEVWDIIDDHPMEERLGRRQHYPLAHQVGLTTPREAIDESESESHGGSGAAAGHDVAVDDHGFLAKGRTA